MPREPDPLNDEELYNVLDFGVLKTPGVVTLSGHDRTIEWDIKAGAGQAGATTTLKAEKPAEFTASIYMTEEEEFGQWPAVRELLLSTVKPKTKGKALDVYHPDLAANGIKSVVLSSLGGVVHDKKGGQTITVKLLEYKPPKPVKVTPLGTTGRGADPNADLQKQLTDLTQQNAETPWKFF